MKTTKGKAFALAFRSSLASGFSQWALEACCALIRATKAKVGLSRFRGGFFLHG